MASMPLPASLNPTFSFIALPTQYIYNQPGLFLYLFFFPISSCSITAPLPPQTNPIPPPNSQQWNSFLLFHYTATPSFPSSPIAGMGDYISTILHIVLQFSGICFYTDHILLFLLLREALPPSVYSMIFPGMLLVQRNCHSCGNSCPTTTILCSDLQCLLL